MYPEFVGHPLRRDYPADKIQPLVAYRDVENTSKLPPFGPEEGMPFGRQTHAGVPDPDASEDAQVNRWNQ
jgi:NADH-quinone oxidoreductase subunit C